MKQRIRMSGALQQRMQLRCSTCNQAIGGPVRDSAANTDASLFGGGKYVVCPSCNQVVPEELRTPAYKSVWTRKRRAQVRHSASAGTKERTQDAPTAQTVIELREAQASRGQGAVTGRDVAEWMYEQVKEKAVLWQAYVVRAIPERFGKRFIDNSASGGPGISRIVVEEFRLLCGNTVIWDERSAHWRLRLSDDK